MNANDADAPHETAPQPDAGEDAAASYARRLKAAGLDDDGGEQPKRADGGVDMDLIRKRVARRIAMFGNQWHGCAEPLCLRNRGCMAPDGLCANVDDGPEDVWDDPDWPRAKDEIKKMLEEEIARRGGLAALEKE